MSARKAGRDERTDARATSGRLILTPAHLAALGLLSDEQYRREFAAKVTQARLEREDDAVRMLQTAERRHAAYRGKA